MMIDKRLIRTVRESKKYIAWNVIYQWISLVANITMMVSIAFEVPEECRFAFQAICEYCRPGKLCLYCNCCGGSGRHPLFLCGTICKNGISFFQGGKESIERKDIQETSSPGKLI